MNLIERAKHFAHEAHDFIGQKRKYSGEPYWVHTDEVAQLGHEALIRQGLSQEVIEEAVAGFHIHDYREDVLTKLIELGKIGDYFRFETIFNSFPPLTRQVVTDLTEVYTSEAFPKSNRNLRKGFEVVRLGTILAVSMTGKLSDLIVNTRDILVQDRNFAVTYLKEKAHLLPYLKGGDETLWNRANEQVMAGMKELGIK